MTPARRFIGTTRPLADNCDTRACVSGCFITMKQDKLLYARACALPAIAAALALTSTQLSAQEAQPVTTPPPATTTTEPAPTPEATPTTTDTTATTTTTEPASPVAKSTTTKTVKRTTRTAPAKPVATTTRATTTRTAVRAAAPAPAAATPAASGPAQPAVPQSTVAPVVDMNAKPATAPAAGPVKTDNTVPILAGIALVLLAFGALVALMARRRRRRDEEAWVYDEPVAEPVAAETVAAAEPEHVVHEEQPPIVAPSAFAWGDQPSERPRADATVDEDDRMPGETWIQRAYRGPTPNNPSVSLKARLKRAAFFDKRERDVAAGTAAPVDMDAGLPDAMVDEQERETA